MGDFFSMVNMHSKSVITFFITKNISLDDFCYNPRDAATMKFQLLGALCGDTSGTNYSLVTIL